MNALMNNQPPTPCHLCGGQLNSLLGYPVAGQVTSDCRPWQGNTLLAACQTCGTVQKALTPEWHQEVARIYAGYAVYAQAEGGEQLSFDSGSGANRSRSQAIVHWLKRQANLPDTGMLLDIGCGNGAFLQAFQQSFPNWQMVGAELDDRNRALVESIPGVLTLHTGPLQELAERFDLIVMIHALEHIPEPIGFLSRLKELLRPSCKLLIEVPDLKASPFDLLITDHCTHFSQDTLRWTVESAGHQVVVLADDCVAKELTLLARGCPTFTVPICPAHPPPWDIDHAERHLRWLQLLLDQANAIEGNVGLFGTSISATWLAKELEGRISFFVDEDSNRIGKLHLGLPILSIEQAPSSLPILMPIRRDIALAVTSRLRSIHPHMIAPPENLN
jgi:SAM-dependent methyltransferase